MTEKSAAASPPPSVPGHPAYPIEDGPTGPGPTPYVTIVLPCFNEGAHVLQEIDRITEAMSASELSYELLCIDDASTDDTLEVLRGRWLRPHTCACCRSAAMAARGLLDESGPSKPAARSLCGPTPI